jgi:adenosylcobinamide amidohydrolase
MKLAQLPSGDVVLRMDKATAIFFSSPREVMSTSYRQGGYRRDLEAVFNYDANPGVGIAPEEGVHERLLEALGLDAKKTAIVATAVPMENAALVQLREGALCVSAVATAGVEVNGGRAGDDPAVWDEIEGKRLGTWLHGTINVMCEISAALPPGAMAEALCALTQGKSAALEELGAPSRYTSGIATGSGSDCAVAISCPHSETKALSAAPHSLAGSLVARAAKLAVREALGKQSGLTYEKSHSATMRMGRHGVGDEAVFGALPAELKREWEPFALLRYHEIADCALREEGAYVPALLMARLLDEAAWGAIGPEAAREGAAFLANWASGEKAPIAGEGLAPSFARALAKKVKERATKK